MLSWKKWIAPHWFGSFRRKVKSAFKAKFAKGQRIFAYVPIGCRKDPEEKCHLLIAEDTRWIIKKIYALAVRGVGAAKTSKVLTQEKGSKHLRQRPGGKSLRLDHSPGQKHFGG